MLFSSCLVHSVLGTVKFSTTSAVGIQVTEIKVTFAKNSEPSNVPLSAPEIALHVLSAARNSA